ncbi:protein SFI1 homolog [Prorops nasuta]|uniref:protein SFI1 homolog n=1 Tax=Prorops nasuta TaxID=863751 RepID=UPI0034CD9AD7
MNRGNLILIIFLNWKKYVAHKKDSKIKISKADFHYKSKLMRKIFEALIIKSSFKRSNVQKKYFHTWYKYVKLKQNRRNVKQRVEFLFRLLYLRRLMILWKNYIIKKKHHTSRRQIHKAIRFERRILLQRSFKQWSQSTNFIQMHAQFNDAIEFNGIRMLKKCFANWKKYVEMRLTKAYLLEKAYLHFRFKLLKHCIKKFQKNVIHTCVKREMFEKSHCFYVTKIKLKIFSKWKQYYIDTVNNCLKIEKLMVFIAQRTKHTFFKNWKLYLLQRKCKRRKMNLADHFYDKRLTIKSLRKLLNYSIYRKEKKVKVSELMTRTKETIFTIQKVYIEKWRTSLNYVLQEKVKVFHAVKMWENNIIRKYYFKWIEFIRLHKTIAVRKEQLNTIAYNFLAKKYIMSWHKMCYKIIASRKAAELIFLMEQRNILKRYLDLWMLYIEKQRNKKAELELAREMHNKMILKEGLQEIIRVALKKIDQRHEEQITTLTAKSKEHYDIKRRYFNKWINTVSFKHHYKPLSLKLQFDPLNLGSSPQLSKSCEQIDFKVTGLVLPEYMKEQKFSYSSDKYLLNNQYKNQSHKFSNMPLYYPYTEDNQFDGQRIQSIQFNNSKAYNNFEDSLENDK